MPAKSAKTTAAAKSSDSVTRKRPTASRTRSKRREPGHGEIAERAYFIHLAEGSADELGNWLRAERELTTA